MQSDVSQPTKRTRRRGIYVLTFLLLTALTAYGLWTVDGVSAEGAAPLGQTIPPGGTIPPAPEAGAEQGQVNVIHVAPVDSEVIDTGVQICNAETNTPVTGYLYYQQQTGYLDLAPDTYDWYVSLAGDNCTNELLDLPPFNIGKGTRISLLIFGDNDNQPLDSLVIVEVLGSFDLYWPVVIK